jgi:iron(III) transport system substrate-binding protein
MSSIFPGFTRRLIATGAVLATLAAGAACSNSGSSGSSGNGDSTGDPNQPTLTLYTGQHEETVDALVKAFTAKTGIGVTIRAGEDADMVNQIVEEGAKTPADLYLSEEPGPIGVLAQRGLLSKVKASSMTALDPRLVPSSHEWMPYAARVRVMYYNPTLIKKSQLPHSILDLTKPEWKGRFAYAPSGAFVGTVSYLIHSIGAQRTLAWLKGIKANGINEQQNGKVRDTVESGKHAFGLSNHYYWWLLAEQKGGPDKLTSKIYYFDHPDAGGLILASGAGILASSKHQAQDQQFLKWLGSADGGQKVIAENSGAQYPADPKVHSKYGIGSVTDLVAPDVDQSVFADTGKAKDLILKAGII